jgi:hypothetical protein
MDEALRLLVEWDGHRYVVRSLERLQMRVPGVSRFERGADGAGRFAELRGKDGAVLARQSVDGRLPEGMSYPTGDPDRPTARAALKAGMLFSVLVPAHPEAAALALVSSRGQPAGAKVGRESSAPATEELLVVSLEGEGL